MPCAITLSLVNFRPGPMTEPEEDPCAAIQAGLQHARELQAKAAESRSRAERLRRMRVANGFDRMLAEVLGGQA